MSKVRVQPVSANFDTVLPSEICSYVDCGRKVAMRTSRPAKTPIIAAKRRGSRTSDGGRGAAGGIAPNGPVGWYGCCCGAFMVDSSAGSVVQQGIPPRIGRRDKCQLCSGQVL